MKAVSGHAAEIQKLALCYDPDDPKGIQKNVLGVPFLLYLAEAPVFAGSLSQHSLRVPQTVKGLEDIFFLIFYCQVNPQHKTKLQSGTRFPISLTIHPTFLQYTPANLTV